MLKTPPKWENIPKKEWLPDQPLLENPGFIKAKNVVASSNGYKPFTAVQAFSAAVSSASTDYVRGATAAKDNAGVSHIYAGDASNLWELSGTTWDKVSVSADDYSGTATTEQWRFLQYGNSVIASNYNNVLQKIEMGSAGFTVLGGSPPRARYLALIRDFIVTGNIVQTDGTIEPRRVKWSAFNRADNWTEDVKTQAGSQQMLEGGDVTGIVGGEYGIIFQENQVSIMSYTGPPTIFRFDTIEKRRGCKVPASIVRYGERTYFLGDDDFYLFSTQGSQGLGKERVAQYFYNQYDPEYRHRMTAAADIRGKRILWAFPNKNATGGAPNEVLIYDMTTNEFTYAEIGISNIFSALGVGYTVETLDNISNNLDSSAFTLSFDDPYYTGGTPKLATFDINNRLGFFEGAPLNAQLETSEMRASPGQHIEVFNVRPLIDTEIGPDSNSQSTPTIKASVGIRNSQQEVIDWGTARTINKWGECNFRRAGRFATIRLETSGSYAIAHGADVKARGAGRA
jgi:hypothetical protein